MTDLISIIVPVYNVEKYLSRCIESIKNQDYKHWECILIDDGSNDKSGDICDEYSLQDLRIRTIHKKNGGVSSARNEGLENATGKWICFVDSDDILLGGALSHMLDVCLQTNADVCLCTIKDRANQTWKTKVLDNFEKKHLIWASLAYRTDEYVKKGFLIDAPHAKLFRSSVITNHNLKFVEGLSKSEDALFDAQFYYNSGRIVMDGFPVYSYTLNPDSICHTYKIENIPMFDTLLIHEEKMIDKYYDKDPMFKNLLNIRTFVALEQVLYESGAEQLSYAERIRSLHLFMDSELIKSILKKTKFSEIENHIIGKSKSIDLALMKRRMFFLMCLWVDFRKMAFRLRVVMVERMKKFLHIDPGTPLLSSFSK